MTSTNKEAAPNAPSQDSGTQQQKQKPFGSTGSFGAPSGNIFTSNQTNNPNPGGQSSLFGVQAPKNGGGLFGPI